MSHDRLNEITGGSHLRIDLDAYQQNLRQIKRLAGVERSVLAVVKANAYGHGAIACAKAAIETGAAYLAVARIDEALQLRRSGIKHPLLVLGAPNIGQLSSAIKHNLDLTIGTQRVLEEVAVASRTVQCPASVHLKVDTGLHRYGAFPDLALSLAREIHCSDWLDFQGIYSHYSSADELDRTHTHNQLDIMNEFIDRLGTEEIFPPHVHIANSAGVVTGELGNSTMVRAGIATYGLNPSAEITLPDTFQPVMSLKSEISRRFQLTAGDAVSYNRTYIATKVEEVGTVPIGYGDGLPRSLQSRGRVFISGCEMPILGRICMDQITVRVPDETVEGDRVTIFGDGSSGEMTADEIAMDAGTNNYEIVTRMSARLPRIYYRSGVADSWVVPILGESGVL